MKATKVSFVSNTGCNVDADTEHNAIVNVRVFREGKNIHTESFAMTDYSSLHRAATKIFQAAGEEAPSSKSIRSFCEALHCLMQNDVLKNLSTK